MKCKYIETISKIDGTNPPTFMDEMGVDGNIIVVSSEIVSFYLGYPNKSDPKVLLRMAVSIQTNGYDNLGLGYAPNAESIGIPQEDTNVEKPKILAMSCAGVYHNINTLGEDELRVCLTDAFGGTIDRDEIEHAIEQRRNSRLAMSSAGIVYQEDTEYKATNSNTITNEEREEERGDNNAGYDRDAFYSNN